MIKQAGGDFRGALEALGKALYLDAAHYESLVHAALIHERKGNLPEANKLRARAQRSQQKGNG